ncbi:hypothetical protein U1Q18_007524 [Sarracenia purpurea var. burkii]
MASQEHLVSHVLPLLVRAYEDNDARMQEEGLKKTISLAKQLDIQSPTLWPCNSFFFLLFTVACSPPTYSHAAAPARRVSTIVVACATAVELPLCGPLRVASVAPSRPSRVIASPSHHRAVPSRPCPPIATLRLLDAAGLRTTGTAELPPPLAASRRLAPLRCSALRTHRRAHCASAPSLTAHLARICATSPVTPLLRHRSRLLFTSQNPELLLSRCSFPKPELLFTLIPPFHQTLLL